MQKKIIALAVAALASTAAFAQTNVTVYGVADVGQAVVKGSAGTTVTGYDVNGDRVTAVAAGQRSVGRLDSNSSYIGFKGVEDLGNGLKAVFQFETAISADNGGGFGAGRDTYVGLAGGFGTVAAGNLTHPLRAFGAKAELLPAAAGFGTMAAVTGTIAGINTGADDRAKNAVAYISPAFSGFTGVVAYVNGENKTTNSAATVTVDGNGFVTGASGAQGNVNSRQWQVAGQYDNGPLFVGVGYHKAYALPLTTTSLGQLGVNLTNFTEQGQDARVIRAVVSYTLPSNTKLTALYDNTKVKLGDVGSSDAVFGTSYIKRNAWSLGVAQGFGKNTVGLEYGHSNKLKGDGGSVDQSASSIVTALYTYDLSKRTMAVVRYSKVSNQENINNNFYSANNPVSANGGTTGLGSDYTGYMVGLRHTF